MDPWATFYSGRGFGVCKVFVVPELNVRVQYSSLPAPLAVIVGETIDNSLCLRVLAYIFPHTRFSLFNVYGEKNYITSEYIMCGR